MKSCQCCYAASSDAEETCAQCGEASWAWAAPTASAKVAPKREPAAEEPPQAEAATVDVPADEPALEAPAKKGRGK